MFGYTLNMSNQEEARRFGHTSGTILSIVATVEQIRTVLFKILYFKIRKFCRVMALL
jgi:hypothetical protein